MARTKLASIPPTTCVPAERLHHIPIGFLLAQRVLSPPFAPLGPLRVSMLACVDPESTACWPATLTMSFNRYLGHGARTPLRCDYDRARVHASPSTAGGGAKPT
jgi:hypothetical protein